MIMITHTSCCPVVCQLLYPSLIALMAHSWNSNWMLLQHSAVFLLVYCVTYLCCCCFCNRANDGCLYVFDRELNKRTLKVREYTHTYTHTLWLQICPILTLRLHAPQCMRLLCTRCMCFRSTPTRTTWMPWHLPMSRLSCFSQAVMMRCVKSGTDAH